VDPVIRPSLVERAATHLRKTGHQPATGFYTGVASPQQSIAPAAPSQVTIVPPPLSDALDAAAKRRTASRTTTLDHGRLLAAHIVNLAGARTRLSEELRIIKRQLLRKAFSSPQANRPGANLFMITSARPGEGKTFTALNLAVSIAVEPDYHVLLIDADTARQGMSETIGLDEQRGLLDVLGTNECELSEVILRTDIPNLALLPTGAERDNAAELLAGPRMGTLLNEISARYRNRIILIDAPPCLVSSDPAALAGRVGEVIMVVEAERTQRDDVEAALEMVTDCSNVSLILNRLQPIVRGSAGEYGSYYGISL
jgi:protein-tyrosine kinase